MKARKHQIVINIATVNCTQKCEQEVSGLARFGGHGFVVKDESRQRIKYVITIKSAARRYLEKSPSLQMIKEYLHEW